MRIRNNARFTRAEIQAVVRFVRPPGISDFDIWVKSGKEHRGRAYTNGTHWRSTSGNFHDRPGFKYTANTPYVLVSIPDRPDKVGKIRIKWPKHKGYLGAVCYNRTEALVHLLAHELRHLWQAKVKRGYRVWGARGQFSERDADAYAIQMLRRWRRSGSLFYGPRGEPL